MNKILLMALVLGTLSTTNVLAATDMATTISSTSSTTATSEANRSVRHAICNGSAKNLW